jgi:pimeloyl-ACP methyl ester carboxylesterase
MDLPREDAGAGPKEYARAVAAALSAIDEEVVVVGHSMGGVTIPNVAALRPVSRLVYLCALVPLPGKSWDETRLPDPMVGEEFEAAIEGRPDGRSVTRREVIGSLYQDSSSELGAAAWERCGPQSYGITQQASLDFPPTPASYILTLRDRALLPEWQGQTAREQLGVEPIELDSDHSPFLARPAALAELLVSLA